MTVPARPPGATEAPRRHRRLPRWLAPLVLSVLILASPGGAVAQDAAPRSEDADLPEGGQVRLGVFPVLQSWFEEFPAGGGGAVPLSEDLAGPLADQVFPGPGAVAASVNRDADALGFAPLSPEEASLGTLEVREVHVDRRTIAGVLEIGVLDRIALGVMIPVVQTEVEPFFDFDSAGVALTPGAAAISNSGAFFGEVADARATLEARIASGEISGAQAEEAEALLQASGVFVSALQDRVEENALIPLEGTRAGSELLARYGELRGGFSSFGIAAPELALAETPGGAFLDDFFRRTLAAGPLDATERPWRAAETEIGLRIGVLRGFRPDPGGIQLRTTVGARARVPFRDPNVTEFVDPSDLLGVPLGDGQPDVELSLYQDVRWGGRFFLSSTFRYGLQLADQPTVRIRSPDRPFAFPDQVVPVDRDLGDYVRARLAPRFRIIPAVSLGIDYRFWRKSADRFERRETNQPIPALEAETEETRHRLGLGLTFRPDPPEKAGASPGGEPELGFTYQTAFSGSGGETPAASLTSFYVRVPIQVF